MAPGSHFFFKRYLDDTVWHLCFRQFVRFLGGVIRSIKGPSCTQNSATRKHADMHSTSGIQTHNPYEDAVFWVVAPCSLVEVYQRFGGPFCLLHQGDEKAARGYQTTQRYNPEDSHLRTHRRENLKSYSQSLCFSDQRLDAATMSGSSGNVFVTLRSANLYW
jgi:hypothetical protein